MDSPKINTKRTLLAIVLSILLLIAAQVAALLAGEGIAALGVPAAVCNAAASVLYPVLTLLGLKLLCGRILKISLADCRIAKSGVKPVWAVCGIFMPMLVVIGFLLVPGHWENPAVSPAQLPAVLSGAILFIGFAGGIVEEAVFRGVIMKAVEMRWNRYAAIFVPSIVFAAGHTIGMEIDLAGFLQLMIAGSAVGILFSLVAYESGSIWSSAWLHGVWNIWMASGILSIGPEAQEGALFNYVLDTDSLLITGGDFGSEASCLSIAVYLAFILLAVLRLRKKTLYDPQNCGVPVV